MRGRTGPTARNQAGRHAQIGRAAPSDAASTGTCGRIGVTLVLLTPVGGSPTITHVKERVLGQDYVHLLLAAVILSQLGDLVTFIAAIGRKGIQAEQNFLARELFIRAGDIGPVLLKAAAVILLVLLVRRVGQRFPTYTAPAAWLAICVGLVGLGSNVVFGLLA